MRANLKIFIPLIVIVVLVQVFLLKPALSTGLEHDDWGALVDIKIHASNIFIQIFNLWTKLGYHHTGQYIYIGTIFNFLNFNYPAYNVINIFFKIIATISIFPVIILVFKSRPLAFLTTIVYAISYSSAGSLAYILQGVYYLAITLMNIFIIFYYLAVSKNSGLYLFLASLTLSLSYVLAAGRIYPIFILILLAEAFLFLGSGKTLAKSLLSHNTEQLAARSQYSVTRTFVKRYLAALLRGSSLRLILLFIPILILVLMGSRDNSALGSPTSTYQNLMNGNLYLLLFPFSALGNLFLPGTRDLIIGDYFGFLMGKYLLILSSLIFIVTLVATKNFIKSFFWLFAINMAAGVTFFIIVNNTVNIPQDSLIKYVSIHTFHALFGIYILTLAGFFLWKWKTNEADKEEKRLLLAAFVGPTFAFIFLSGIWIIVTAALHLYDAYGGINRYFTFPALGSSLFIGSVLALVLNKTASKGVLIKGVGLTLIFLVIILLLQISKNEIDFGFRQINSGSTFLLRNSYLHKNFQEKLMSQIDVEKLRDKETILFYFEFPGEEKDYYAKAIDLYSMPQWLYLRLGITGSKCIEVVDDEKELNKQIEVRQGLRKLVSANEYCIGYTGEASTTRAKETGITYNIQKNFYAFRIQPDGLTNITKEIIKKLRLE